jgi:F-box domain
MGQGDSNSNTKNVQCKKRVEGRKRSRENSKTADIENSNKDINSHEPHYVIVTDNSSVEVSLERPAKKIRLIVKDESKLFQMIPTEVLHNILAYCGSTEDRFALQVTCKTFQRISNDSTELLANVALGGDITGRGSLLREEDTPETASIKLAPYCKAGNLEAIYM